LLLFKNGTIAKYHDYEKHKDSIDKKNIWNEEYME
jgi:hypothetical protein